jgi:lipoprotein-releasing system permease protein
VRLKLDDPMLAPLVKANLQQALGQQDQVTDWTDTNANYFRAVQIEKRMMTIILTLIVAVAAFNLVSTLVMVVTDKQADIAILRTLARHRPASCRFSRSGLGGRCQRYAGRGGRWRAGGLNLDVIVPLIERVLGTKLLSSEVYMIDYLPSDVQLGDVSTITVIALLLALLATIYPSWRQRRTAAGGGVALRVMC